MKWVVPRMWEGGDVWIIGGGPSVPKQFGIPERVVQSVVSGKSPSEYSPFMSFLHDKHVIGINVAYLIGDWIDIVFFGDGGFYNQHQEALAISSCLKVSCNPLLEKNTWVKFLYRDSKVLGISDNQGSVSWNHNSGNISVRF
jgi:hypothetical protein